MMPSSDTSGAAVQAEADRLRGFIDALSDQLCGAVRGDFDFTVYVDAQDETFEKLQMLVNFVLDTARRSLAQVEQKKESLAKTNEQLAHEIVERKRAQGELLAAHDALEQRVHERTHELAEANTMLQEQRDRLFETATEIGTLMADVVERNVFTGRFRNPQLVRCWEVKHCNKDTCPSFGREDDLRCWQQVGTFCSGEVQGHFAKKLKDCRLCEVYQRARPDSFHNLGETFNDMVAILRERHDALDEARNAAEAANQAKSAFLANMSHEIRTPMTAVLGFADNLQDPDLEDAARTDAVQTIRRNGEHLLGVINDILDLSKIESGKMTIERIPCSVGTIVAEVASLIRVRFAEKKLTYDTEFLGSVPETIQSDPTRLRQILINLLGNAVKFTETGGVRIIVRCVLKAAEPLMLFDIVDTGLGMTDEQAARIFQPFSQADASTTRKFGGSGLGLAISKRLAAALGGDVTLVETAVGTGSRFRLTIATGPLAGVKMLEDPTAALALQPAVHVDSEADTGRLDCRILLAEDGPDNQRLIAHILTKAGAEVTVVENGQLAMEAALAAMHARRAGDPAHPFDVILMDMQMPVLDGYQATSLLREKGYTGPIIALTAHAMASDREQCLAAGCDDYASKPIDRAKLIATIRQHVCKEPAPMLQEQRTLSAGVSR